MQSVNSTAPANWHMNIGEYIYIYIQFCVHRHGGQCLLRLVPKAGNITTLDGASLKLVDKFTYLGSSVSSTENDIDTRLTKAWTAIDWLSIIWKSDLTDKMKCSFFQAAVVSILLYGCTTWTLTKRLEKKLDGNYTRTLRAILNKSWRQHPTRRQLYGHLPPITKTIQVRRTRHAGHCWRSKDELVSDVLLWTLHMAKRKQDDQLEPTYSSYVKTQDVALKTCRRRWTIGRSGERWSGISVLAARHDDDDDDDIYIYIYICLLTCTYICFHPGRVEPASSWTSTASYHCLYCSLKKILWDLIEGRVPSPTRKTPCLPQIFHRRIDGDPRPLVAGTDTTRIFTRAPLAGLRP